MMKGKGWNGVIHTHKVTLEALWAVLWAAFKAWSEESGKVVSDNLGEAAGRVADAFASKDNDSLSLSFANLLLATKKPKFSLLSMKLLVLKTQLFSSVEPI